MTWGWSFFSTTGNGKQIILPGYDRGLALLISIHDQPVILLGELESERSPCVTDCFRRTWFWWPSHHGKGEDR